MGEICQNDIGLNLLVFNWDFFLGTVDFMLEFLDKTRMLIAMNYRKRKEKEFIQPQTMD